MAQSAAGGLGTPFRQLSVRPHADLRRFRRWCRCRQWPHPCDILTLSSMLYEPNASSLVERDTLLCILLDYYNIKRIRSIPVERPPGSATPVLPSLGERLYHFETNSRRELLSGWADVPRLECRPWKIANVSPGSTEPSLHSSHRCYLIAADVMQSRDEFRWDRCHRRLGLRYLLDRLLWRLLYRLLWGRPSLGHFRKSRQGEHSAHEYTPESDHNHRFAHPCPVGKRPTSHGILWGR